MNMKTPLSLALILLGSASTLPAEVDQEIQLGVEAVTGFRTGYVYRGFELAESTLDFQVEAEIALTNQVFLNVGAWYATETGQGNFDESAFFTHLRFEKDKHLTLGLSATYRSFSHRSTPLSVAFEDGVDLGAFATWNFCRDFSATLGAYYDTGANAWYGKLETRWTKPISDKAFFSLETGISVVEEYYGRSGLNDAYTRLSLTYNISDTVSITPFVGGSTLLDSNDLGDDQTFGGVWFEVRF